LSRAWSTAYHEADAVIARVLRLASGGATIKLDYVEGTAGFHITYDPYTCLYEWEKRSKVREVDAAMWHARIMTFMSGIEAEVELLGSTVTNDSDDQLQIALMAEQLPGLDFWHSKGRTSPSQNDAHARPAAP
jgi:hypothetical protein